MSDKGIFHKASKALRNPKLVYHWVRKHIVRYWKIKNLDSMKHPVFGNLRRVEFENLIFLYPSPNQLLNAILFEGGWEPNVSQQLPSIIKPGMTVIDVGAQMGYYTALFAKYTGPYGNVIAFEPDKYKRSLLTLNIALNLLDNTTIYKQALFSESQNMKISSEESRLIPATSEELENNDAIPVARLDDIIDSNVEIDLVKIDIEGAELNALQGMEYTITNSKPRLIIEVHPPKMANYGFEPSEIIQWLVHSGYLVRVIKEDGKLEPLGTLTNENRVHLLCIPDNDKMTGI